MDNKEKINTGAVIANFKKYPELNNYLISISKNEMTFSLSSTEKGLGPLGIIDKLMDDEETIPLVEIIFKNVTGDITFYKVEIKDLEFLKITNLLDFNLDKPEEKFLKVEFDYVKAKLILS